MCANVPWVTHSVSDIFVYKVWPAANVEAQPSLDAWRRWRSQIASQVCNGFVIEKAHLLDYIQAYARSVKVHEGAISVAWTGSYGIL